jgi:hypothetical protein
VRKTWTIVPGIYVKTAAHVSMASTHIDVVVRRTSPEITAKSMLMNVRRGKIKLI